MRLPSLTTSPPMMAGSTLMCEIDVLAADRMKRAFQRGDMVVLELFGNRDLGGGLALVVSDQLAERLDHIAHGKQPAVGRNELEEFCRKPADAGALEHRRKRLQLLVGGEDRAANQPHQVGAFGDKRSEAVQVRLHRVDRVRSRAQARTKRSRSGRPCRIRWSSSPAKSALYVALFGSFSANPQPARRASASPWDQALGIMRDLNLEAANCPAQPAKSPRC